MKDEEKILREYFVKIKRWAPRQWVPLLDSDDVASEMWIVLWKAMGKHDPEEAPLDAFFWKCWKKRRVELTRHAYANKRGAETPVGGLDDLAGLSGPMTPLETPVCPSGDALEMLVWSMLAAGYTPGDLKVLLNLSTRRYYQVRANLQEVSA